MDFDFCQCAHYHVVLYNPKWFIPARINIFYIFPIIGIRTLVRTIISLAKSIYLYIYHLCQKSHKLALRVPILPTPLPPNVYYATTSQLTSTEAACSDSRKSNNKKLLHISSQGPFDDPLSASLLNIKDKQKASQYSG